MQITLKKRGNADNGLEEEEEEEGDRKEAKFVTSVLNIAGLYSGQRTFVTRLYHLPIRLRSVQTPL